MAGTRTLDQCLKRALLYQLSYQPILAQNQAICEVSGEWNDWLVTLSICAAFCLKMTGKKTSQTTEQPVFHKVAENPYRLESSDDTMPCQSAEASSFAAVRPLAQNQRQEIGRLPEASTHTTCANSRRDCSSESPALKTPTAMSVLYTTICSPSARFTRFIISAIPFIGGYAEMPPGRVR